MKGPLTLSICTLGVLLAAGCSREPEPIAATAPPASTDPNSLQAQAWIDDVQLGSTVSAQQTIATPVDKFAPGEPIHLAMAVDDAPAAATVSVRWYGPENMQLGYENKEIAPTQRQMTFEQDNTADWQRGEYRAEIWVGDEKVAEKSFFIVGDASAGV